MGRDKLERALERAAERIALGEKRIAHQMEIIAELDVESQQVVLG